MNRLKRVNQLVKRELSQILNKELDFSNEILVTITRVETSADLRQAEVWVSVMSENHASKILKILNYSVYDLQQILNKRLEMRPVPKIKFLEEKEVARAARIEELLEQVQKKNDQVNFLKNK